MDRHTRGHILVGAILSFVFLPHSGAPLLGGALAGYLEGSELQSGAVVGVLAGLVALIALLVVTVVDVLLGGLEFGFSEVLFEGIYWPVRQGIVPLVVLPLVGGAIGAYVNRETTGKSGR